MSGLEQGNQNGGQTDSLHPVGADTGRTENGMPELRQIQPDEITAYLDREWNRQVSVDLSPPGHPIRIPDDWHGAGKTGDALVLTGDTLTTPIAGTELSGPAFTDWLSDQGFVLHVCGEECSSREAGTALESAQTSIADGPVFRAVRTPDRGVPIVLEFYNGAATEDMQLLSFIGNEPQRTEEDAEAYRGIVAKLMRPFIGKGTTKAKEAMGIRMTGAKRVRRLDDCAAAGTTIATDMMLDDHQGIPKPDFDETGVAVATTQAMTVAVWLAENRQVPLLFRAGAPAFGLGDQATGLNYMINTLPSMRGWGKFTSGDFGVIMSTGREQHQQPCLVILGDGNPYHETRIYYNGGGPVQEMMMRRYSAREKPFHGILHVLRASRVDHGMSQWGVLFNGKWVGRSR